jgi:hypothetical protein
MIKKVASMTAMIVTGLALSAQANIFVQWQASTGFYDENDNLGILEPISGQTAYAQLIYTPVAAYSSSASAVGGGVDAGFTIIDTFIITDSGGNDAFATFADIVNVDPFQAGFIYARVFDGGTGNPANIVGGTWYYQSALVATVDNNTLNPTIVDIQGNNPTVNNSAFGGDFLFLQVPEPSTMAFLGIGGMILALRRRKA